MSNKPSENKNWTKLAISLCIIIIFLSLVGAISYYIPSISANDLPVSIVNNTFIDVNGDGKQDFVKYMEVIINDGSLNPNP